MESYLLQVSSVVFHRVFDWDFITMNGIRLGIEFSYQFIITTKFFTNIYELNTKKWKKEGLRVG